MPARCRATDHRAAPRTDPGQAEVTADHVLRALTARTSYKRAILANAYALLCIAHAALRNQQRCGDPSIDEGKLHAERNAPR